MQKAVAEAVKMLGREINGDTEEQGHYTKRWSAQRWIEDELQGHGITD